MANLTERVISDVMQSFDWKSAVEPSVVFKTRDSVPSAR